MPCSYLLDEPQTFLRSPEFLSDSRYEMYGRTQTVKTRRRRQSTKIKEENV